jgi:hypothetical protein
MELPRTGLLDRQRQPVRVVSVIACFRDYPYRASPNTIVCLLPRSEYLLKNLC